MEPNIGKSKLKLKKKQVELISLGLLMACRSMLAFFNRSLRESGLTVQQIYCLYGINEYRGHHLRYIAGKLYMDKSSITRCVHNLKEYIKVEHHDGNKKHLYAELTVAGTEKFNIWFPKVLELENSIGALIKDRDSFISFIHTFSGDLSKKAIALKKIADSPSLDKPEEDS